MGPDGQRVLARAFGAGERSARAEQRLCRGANARAVTGRAGEERSWAQERGSAGVCWAACEGVAGPAGGSKLVWAGKKKESGHGPLRVLVS